MERTEKETLANESRNKNWSCSSGLYQMGDGTLTAIQQERKWLQNIPHFLHVFFARYSW